MGLRAAVKNRYLKSYIGKKRFVNLNFNIDLHNTGISVFGHVLTRLCFVRNMLNAGLIKTNKRLRPVRRLTF